MTLQTHEHGVVMMPMLATIMVAAYIGGRNAGLATSLVAVIAALYVASPLGLFWPSSIHDFERVIAIACLGIAISFTVEALHRARRRAEVAYEAAHRGEARFMRLFAANPVANILTRLSDSIVVDVNEAFCRTFGIRREDIVDSTPKGAGLVFAEGLRERLLAEVRAGGTPHPIEAEVCTRDGAPRHVIIQSEAIEVDGELLMMSSLLDVTACKLAEAEAQASQRQFEQLAEAIDEVIWMIDARTGQRLYVSPAYEKVWGRPPAELWASSDAWMAAIHPDDRERIMTAFRETELPAAYEDRYRIVRPDGAVRWIRDKAFPIRDERGAIIRIAGIAQDITEMLSVAQKLQQAQKLESIGLLAGGVAHDFNNILCAITANAEMLADAITKTDPRSEWVGEIQLAADRATGLTRQLLAFGRKQIVNPVVLDLNKTVDDARRMLRRMLGADIALRVALDPDAGRVLVDPGQIVQVLMNLCVNARDAMGAGGSIFIETRAEKGSALLIVSDSGPGMRDDVKARVFEPFFTTKPVGKGTGLGLAVVHGIVEQAGGSIELESELGKGSSFRIRLPVVACQASAEPELVWSPAAGTETILLVDDDEPLRVACARSLEKLGYRVIQARDGIDGLRVLRRSGREIDMLVTDVVMPNMNGPQLAAVAARECPGSPSCTRAATPATSSISAVSSRARSRSSRSRSGPTRSRARSAICSIRRSRPCGARDRHRRRTRGREIVPA